MDFKYPAHLQNAKYTLVAIRVWYHKASITGQIFLMLRRPKLKRNVKEKTFTHSLKTFEREEAIILIFSSNHTLEVDKYLLIYEILILARKYEMYFLIVLQIEHENIRL